MKLRKLIILLIVALGCTCSLAAQSDSEKKERAIEILTADDYYSVCLEGEWDSKTFDVDKLTKKARKQLVEKTINPERKKRGLRTSFSVDRWIPVLNTIVYRDRDFGRVVVYISEKDMIAFGAEPADSSVPVVTASAGESGPSSASAGASAAGTSARKPVTGPFNLPEGVKLDVPAGVLEAALELYNHSGQSTAEADDMIYALFEDNVITDAAQLKDPSELQSNRILYEIDGDKVGRIAGYCNVGEYYDLRTGQVLSKSEFATSKWIVVEYDPHN